METLNGYGDAAIVAKALNVTSNYVRKVVNGKRKSVRIMEALQKVRDSRESALRETINEQ